ncbi:helix-turn-helix transcriptional regulator [Streptomyces arenae]|uniref:helix-turn-helix transcriptional regulator n=1 Tax=Streptomyces arenae TaxID=29301 RepID=UPI00265A9481|nr:LuxR family transcriptional regulator [Streptomyces arenae]MCG7210863.1 AAA family ATPase [Streptomyces arenae]
MSIEHSSGPGPVGGDAVGLLGRSADLEFFAELRRRLADGGAGTAVLLEGPAGVGKTALLEAAAGGARASGFRVLRFAGVESEVTLAYSGLHQLLFGMRDGFDRLPPGQRAVLEGVLGSSVAQAPPERFAASVAVLEVLRRTAEDGPVLVVIDDVQWLDRASGDVLEFVARRLSGLPVDLLVAARAGHAHALDRHGLLRRRVETLDERSAAALLRAAHPGLAPPASERLLQEAAGNPLALLELPALLTREQFAGAAPLPLSLPVDDRLEALFAPRLRELPAATLELLLVAALEGTGGLGTVWAAYPGGMEAADAALPAAEEAGLVRVDARAGRLVFRHPLVRSAVVRTCRPGQRRAAHRALAEALERDPERRIGHLVAASLGPEEHLAADLEQAGHAALGRGSAALAVTALRRAAELSPEPAERSRRLAHAAYAAAQSGALDVTAVLVDDGYGERASPQDTARATLARVYALLETDGDATAAHRLLTGVIDGLLATGTDGAETGGAGTGGAGTGGAETSGAGRQPSPAAVREVVGELQFLLTLVAFYAQRTDLWPEVLERCQDAPDQVRLYCLAFDAPQERAPEVRRRIRRAFAALPPDAGPRPVTQLSMLSVYFDEASEYREHWMRVARRSREGGTFVQWSYGTILLGHEAFFAGRFAEAEALAREGLAMAEELGHRLAGFRLASQLALVAAVRGDAETVGTLTRTILAWSEPRRLGLLQVSARQARALLALGRGDYETAYHDCALVSPPGTLPPLNPRAIWSVYDLVEAAVYTGRTAEARVHVAMARSACLGELSPRLALLTHAAAALAGPVETAEAGFRRALAVADVHAPFDRARVQLAFGRWLRAHGRDPEAAREHLTAALHTLEELGAVPWAAATATELAALTPPAEPEPLDAEGLLTRQELQIADLAATGLSNKEIGARLYISPRTVSTHLYNIFPKLGIRSRAALRDALGAQARAAHGDGHVEYVDGPVI